MKIYTKTGDKGETALFSGSRVSKASSYIEAFGSVDELNAWMGYCASGCTESDIEKQLKQIQNDLHSLCADLATPLNAKKSVERIDGERAVRLENWIDESEKELKPLTQFILAGGTELASRLHVGRTVARRAERAVIAHGEKEKINQQVVVYLNRLSDLLFVLARLANKRRNVADIFWT